VRAALAITQTPQNASSWQRLGPIFPQVKWSKSGALLVRDPATAQRPHLLFWGDSSIENGLQVPHTAHSDYALREPHARTHAFPCALNCLA
jgi:hypothetical protein